MNIMIYCNERKGERTDNGKSQICSINPKIYLNVVILYFG